MKKLCLTCILFLLLLSLSGSAQETDFHWDVYTYGFEAAAHLEAQEDVLQYDGSTAVANHEETAPEGFVFLLAEMYIEKNGARRRRLCLGEPVFGRPGRHAVFPNGKRYLP